MIQYSVAVVGNPNCGKSTVFNGLTGSNQHIGNWPGVTVEKKSGLLAGTEDIEVVDLPGLYSLNAGSEDEVIAKNHLLSGTTDLVVNIADASNLERNLFLTMTLQEMRKPMLLVLSMNDMAKKNGIDIDTEALSRILGIPVIAINALNGADIRDVRRLIKKSLPVLKSSEPGVNYPQVIETVINQWACKLNSPQRQTTLMLLEEDEETTATVVESGCITSEEIQSQIETIEEISGNPPDVIIAEAKFTCISAIVKKVVGRTKGISAATEKIDKIVLSRWAGIPIFLGIMYLLFWVVTHLSGAFIDFFDILFGAIFVEGFGILLEAAGLPDWLVVLLAGGLGSGIQTISTFIPVIFFMFLMLSTLEDSGYMARAAFVMDRLMQKIGLPGKAFVPMLTGFGCTVPAVMATRTLENKKDRYLTVFMAPFMSCGARLPVYALFGTAFFGTHSGLMIYAIYLSGFALAIGTGFILKDTLFRGASSHFVMELPPYHQLQLGLIMSRTWNRLKIFIFRAGKVIIIAVLMLTFFNSLGTDGSFGNENNTNSILAELSEAVTPIFEPMGIETENWPATVGLMAGLFAKEAIVGTMTGLYGQMAASENAVADHTEKVNEFSLSAAFIEAIISIRKGMAAVLSGLLDPLGISLMKDDKSTISEEIGNEATLFGQLRLSFDNDWTRAFAYLLFVLIYFPCIAAFGAIVGEIGPGYGWLAMMYLTILAWSVATVFFQIATGHSIFWIIFSIALVALFIPVFNLISGRWTVFNKGRKSFNPKEQ